MTTTVGSEGIFGHSIAGAAASGILCGCIHVVGPDHLGTLMTLSTLLQPFRAFKVGAAWGLGHSTGMVLVSALFLSVHGLLHNKIIVQDWEHYGNYVIGISMVLCGLYFMYSEKSFLEEQPDGTFKTKSCSCRSRSCSYNNGKILRKSRGIAQPRLGRKGAKFISAPVEDIEAEASENQPLLEEADDESEAEEVGKTVMPLRPSRGVDLKGLLLGVLQGLCCPMGLVGMTFLVNLHMSGILAFLAMFILVSVLGTGLVAAFWAYFSSLGFGQISPKTVYHASCGFTLMLGAVWIIANYCGLLELLDYTEGVHSTVLNMPVKK